MTREPAPGDRARDAPDPRVRATLVAPGPELDSRPVEALELTLEGARGDRHAGLTRSADVRVPHHPRGSTIRNTRQLTIVSEEELRAIAQRLDVRRVDGSSLGANLVLSGVSELSRLPSGLRMLFPSGATIVVDAENLPCAGPGEALARLHPERPDLPSAFPKAAWRLRGVTAWVERAGAVRVGDRPRLLTPLGDAWRPDARC